MRSAISEDTGHVSRMKEDRRAFRILERLLGRPRRRWENNIRSDLNEVDINTRNWVESAQDRIIGEPL